MCGMYKSIEKCCEDRKICILCKLIFYGKGTYLHTYICLIMHRYKNEI